MGQSGASMASQQYMQQGYSAQYAAQSSQQIRQASMAAQQAPASARSFTPNVAGQPVQAEPWMVDSRFHADPRSTTAHRQIAEAAALRQQQAYAAQQSRGGAPSMSAYGGGTMHVHNTVGAAAARPTGFNRAPKARLHNSVRHTRTRKALEHPLAHFFVAESTKALLRRRMELRYAMPNPEDPAVAELPHIVNDE